MSPIESTCKTLATLWARLLLLLLLLLLLAPFGRPVTMPQSKSSTRAAGGDPRSLAAVAAALAVVLVEAWYHCSPAAQSTRFMEIWSLGLSPRSGWVLGRGESCSMWRIV